MHALFVLVCCFAFAARAQPLTVFAAASLGEAFTEIAEAFESETGVEVTLNLAGSATLSAQLLQGAPADLFASADLRQLERALPAAEPVIFAQNHMTVLLAEHSPLKALEDLASTDYLLVLAGPDVPAGHYARQVLDKLEAAYGPAYKEAVLRHLVSEETNVRQAAAKVALGEADAAFVYVSDARAFDALPKLELPEVYNVRADYPIGVVPDSPNIVQAQAFISFLLSESAQATLQSYGFLPAP